MSRRKKDNFDDILALPHTKLIRGKPYVIIVQRDAAGGRHEKTRRVDSVAEALSAIEKLKQEIQQEIGAREPDSEDGEKMAFAELVERYERAKQIPKHYKTPMVEQFGDRLIRTITYGDIEEFKAVRSAVPKKFAKDKLRSVSTINRELEALRTVILYAMRHEWILKNPFSKGAPLIKKSEEESRERPPTPEEEARILEFCTDFKSWVERKRSARGMTAEDLATVIGLEVAERLERGERLKDREVRQVADAIGASPYIALKVAEGDRSHLRPILIAAKDTGLRRGALLSLTWSMVGFKVEDGETVIGDILRIPKGPRNKKRPPSTGLTARLREELSKLWQKSDKSPQSLIFGGITEIKRSYKTVCKLAGVTGLTVHDWRHGNITDMMEAGVEQRVAMRAAGHTDPDTHAIYSNIDERIAREIARRLDELHKRRQGGEGVPVEPNSFIN